MCGGEIAVCMEEERHRRRKQKANRKMLSVLAGKRKSERNFEETQTDRERDFISLSILPPPSELRNERVRDGARWRWPIVLLQFAFCRLAVTNRTRSPFVR